MNFSLMTHSKHKLLLALGAAMFFSSSSAPSRAQWDAPMSVGATNRVTSDGLDAHRPQFSPSGDALVFYAGPLGREEIYTLTIASGDVRRLTENDYSDVDPTFTRDGLGVVWSGNGDGDYDLFEMVLADESVRRVTDYTGDEREPVVSPISFSFYAIGDDSCTGATGDRLETYDKVLFSRRDGDRSEVWFLGASEGLVGTHEGRISPEGSNCFGPSWARNGLSAAFVCDDGEGTIARYSDASWQPSFNSALATLQAMEVETCWDVDIDDWLTDDCLSRLPRSYATYPSEARSQPSDNRAAPAYSANQVVLLTSNYLAGGVSIANRDGGDWVGLDLSPALPRNTVWSPAGTQLAFESEHEGESAIYLTETDFYLQDVVNLLDYPELVSTPSRSLHTVDFVARPGDAREFWVHYEEIEYADRPVYVTVDAALQAFNDEFTRILRRAETDAQDRLSEVSEGLYQHYAAQYEATTSDLDAYMAAYFAAPMLFLRSAAVASQTTAAGPGTSECEDELRWMGHRSADEQAEVRERCAAFLNPTPTAELMGAHLEPLVEELPAAVRERVTVWITQALAHSNFGEIEVPNLGTRRVDFTQFQVRGDYAFGDRAGYFLAMMWYGLVPIAADEYAFELIDALAATAPTGPSRTESSLLEVYGAIDAFIGSFMGRPVDVSISHLQVLRADHPGLLSRYQTGAVSARLAELLGPVGVRGLQGALDEFDPLPVSDYQPLFLFPRRLGHDVTYFSNLTTPSVGNRVRPSVLDVFAGLGSDRALAHALADESGAGYYDVYRARLHALIDDTAGRPESFWSTDVYHSWLATLATLAQPADPPEPLAFTQSTQWADRLLWSAIGGYAELKHASVLYGVEDYSVECGGDFQIYGLVEQPDIPPPRGFVDPYPDVYRSLAQLAQQVYTDMNGGRTPNVDGYLPDGSEIGRFSSVRVFAEQLAVIAQQEIDGAPISEADYAWLQRVGPGLEAMFLSFMTDSLSPSPAGDDRTERGVALVVSVHTANSEALHLGVGRVMDFYVAVPDTVGNRLTQGGIFSVYSFWHQIADRLTDQAWNALIESGQAPDWPAWASFVEPAPDDAE